LETTGFWGLKERPWVFPPHKTNMEKEKRVSLNVGGQQFETTMNSIMKYPDSLLGVMFSDRNMKSFRKDHHSTFFDRNGRMFEIVLEFVRRCSLIIPSQVSPHAVKAEFDFFQIPWPHSLTDHSHLFTESF